MEGATRNCADTIQVAHAEEQKTSPAYTVQTRRGHLGRNLAVLIYAEVTAWVSLPAAGECDRTEHRGVCPIGPAFLIFS
jgi:hypothetical protein